MKGSIQSHDVLTTRKYTTAETDIFRKPTTNTTIQEVSNHPTEHKLAAHRSLIYQ
jgi:hypothetical protein